LNAMPRSVDRQGLQILVEDLGGDDLADIATAVHQRDQLFRTRDLRPINRAISSQDTNALAAWQREIHIADCAEELFVDWTFPNLRICCFSPNWCNLFARQCRSIKDESIE